MSKIYNVERSIYDNALKHFDDNDKHNFQAFFR